LTEFEDNEENEEGEEKSEIQRIKIRHSCGHSASYPLKRERQEKNLHTKQCPRCQENLDDLDKEEDI